MFEVTVTQSHTVEEVGGLLKTALDMGLFSLSGSVTATSIEDVEDIKKNLKFKFHGDTIIDPPPQTFDDAVEVKSVP